VSAPGSRTHLVLYRLLAGTWYASMAAMIVGLPVLVVAVLTSGGHPAYVLWATGMLLMLVVSLRVRGRGAPPGRVLTREEAPRLHDLVEEARRVAGIGPVREIRLTGTPNVGVTRVFRGGVIYTRPVKVLVVGLPYLRSLTVPELESILLHEFAHFLGHDVHRGEEMAVIEARLGNLRAAFERSWVARWGWLPYLLLRWANPVYLWVRLYGVVFDLATTSIRRRQEILADALAAETCGPLTYSRALLKAASIRRLFARVALRRVSACARGGGAPPANLFLEFRRGVRAMSPGERRRAIREAREAPEPSRSMHPPMAERLVRLGRLHVPRRRVREERASNLVPVLESVEEEMTPSTVMFVVAAMVVKARRRGLAPVQDAASEAPAPRVPAAEAAPAIPALPMLLLPS
jgi:Zn-dependent protease with chaperone function